MSTSSSLRPRLPLGGTHPAPRKRVIRSTRPALVGLYVKEDVWLVGQGSRATIYLGERRLLNLAVTSFDLPALNRILWQVRLGEARRKLGRQTRVDSGELES
jgi:hypothetical protein